MRHKIRKAIHFIKHQSHTRRSRAFAILAVINVILAFLIYSNLLTYPNTLIGTMNVSGKTAGQIKAMLAKEQATLPTIQVKDRIYQFTYPQLGIVIDENRAIRDVFTPNRMIFPVNLAYFIRSLFASRVIPQPVMFTQEFDQFVTDTTFSFGAGSPGVSVDPETKSLVVDENSQEYRFDRNNIQELLFTHFGNYAHPIYPMLAKVTNETISQVSDTNQKLAQIFSQPIMVYLDMGGSTQAVELKEEDIRKATTITVNPATLAVTISVNSAALNTALTQRIHETGFPIRDNLVTENVQNDFLKAIQLRYAGTDIAAVSTVADDGPNTDGSLADAYIEVDITQQKMYLFKGGSEYKSYKVSTGRDYPTPTGKFTVLNKANLGYSEIYNVWMPYWMGFSYSMVLHAYFGIHELPYTLTGNNKIQRPLEFLGTPNTGGCIALAPGAAAEVYAFAPIGMPVYIYN